MITSKEDILFSK